MNELIAKLGGLWEALMESSAGWFSEHSEDLVELQRQQLFAGRDIYGNDIRPYYSEDLQPGGYFRSAESAERYKAKKAAMSYPYNASRNADAPNLYYAEGAGAGRFHSELTMVVDAESAEIVGSSPYSNGIIAKYPDAIGLSEDSLDSIMPEFMESISNDVRQWIES